MMNWAKFKLFFSFLSPFWMQEAAMFLLMIAATTAGLASPYALKIILDDDIPQKNYRGLLFILCGLVLTYLLRLGFDYLSEYLTTWIGNKVINNIKITLFSNLVRFPYSYFEDNKPGDIIQKVNLEVHKVQSFLTSSLTRFCSNIFTLAGLTVMLLLLDRRLFLISASVFPIAILINRSFTGKLKRLIVKSSQQEGDVYNFLIDRLRNIKLIKGLNGAAREIDAIRQRYFTLFGLYQKTTVYSSLSRNLSSLLVVLGPVVVLAYGGRQAIAGTLSIGALIAFIQYLNRLYAPANDMVYLYTDYIRVKVSMDRIFPLLSGQYGADDRMACSNAVATMRPTRDPIHCINLDNIHFAYGGQKVLRGANIQLSKGKRYGLVGMSGSGKTTLIKLLNRFYVPDKGQISVNGEIHAEKIDVHSWNEHLTIVHQEPLLFKESLRFNLTYGNQRATDDEIWAALDDADCLPFVSLLPALLDTPLGEGEDGIQLSGGQQQQISLARAFLRNTDVLILDEASSAIDSFKERKILQRLKKRFENKLVLSVSHRLSSIRDFDEILVLAEGRLTERGTHDQLIRLRGTYYKQFEAQLGDIERQLC